MLGTDELLSTPVSGLLFFSILLVTLGSNLFHMPAAWTLKWFFHTFLKFM